MTYRDDHEAALERVDALEKELGEARSDDARAADQIARLEAALSTARGERDRAEAELAKLRPKPAPAPARPVSRSTSAPPPEEPMPQVNPARAVIVGVGVVAIVIAIAVAATSGSNKKHEGARGMVDDPAKPQPTMLATPDATSAKIEEGIARALAKLPGAHLAKIDIRGIDEHGIIHAEYEGGLDIRVDKTREPPAPPPPRPIGAPPLPVDDRKFDCVQVMSANGGWTDFDPDMCAMLQYSLYPTSWDIAVPTCTPSTIWKLALADGAPAGAIAHIGYDGSWNFEIADERAKFSKRYADSCSVAERPAPGN